MSSSWVAMMISGQNQPLSMVVIRVGVEDGMALRLVMASLLVKMALPSFRTLEWADLIAPCFHFLSCLPLV